MRFLLLLVMGCYQRKPSASLNILSKFLGCMANLFDLGAPGGSFLNSFGIATGHVQSLS